MKKKTLYFSVVAVVIVLVLFGFYVYQPAIKPAPDAKNATYYIDNQPVVLVNGRSEQEMAPGSASRIITQYFGNEVVGDFNNDGKKDVAFLLSQTTGGSGTFYYVAVALGLGNGVKGTNAVFFGDRIAPQSTVFQNGEIIVNYADRNPGEPMSINPSLGVSKYFKLDGQNLVEIKK